MLPFPQKGPGSGWFVGTGEGAEAESHHRSPITQSGGDRAGDSLSRCPHASCHPGPPNPRHKPCPELRAWPWARWAWSSQPNCCYFLSDELQTASLPTSNRLQGVPLSPSQLTHVHKVPQPQRQPMLTLGLCARGAWSELGPDPWCHLRSLGDPRVAGRGAVGLLPCALPAAGTR